MVALLSDYVDAIAVPFQLTAELGRLCANDGSLDFIIAFLYGLIVINLAIPLVALVFDASVPARIKKALGMTERCLWCGHSQDKTEQT